MMFGATAATGGAMFGRAGAAVVLATACHAVCKPVRPNWTTPPSMETSSRRGTPSTAVSQVVGGSPGPSSRVKRNRSPSALHAND